jgi:hypothetical protein
MGKPLVSPFFLGETRYIQIGAVLQSAVPIINSLSLKEENKNGKTNENDGRQ